MAPLEGRCLQVFFSSAVKGLTFDLSIPRYALQKGLGRFWTSAHYGPLSCLSFRDRPEPALPGPGWVRLRPRLTGLCGSDLSTIFLKASPQLSPFTSFPAVLGHEVMAEVVDPAGADGLRAGQRVVVDPLLPCRLRAIEQPCRPCVEGRENGCERVADGCLAPGLMLGFHRDLPGGMSTAMVAHHSQLHAVPDEVGDEAAALVEPLSVSLHAVLRNPPSEPGDKGEDAPVLVIGGGPVAFCTLWALRAAGFRNPVFLLALDPYQLELAKALGADDAFRPLGKTDEAREIGRRTGARFYDAIIGPQALTGGFAQVFDCVGSASSLQTALRYTRAFGKVVLLGAAGHIHALDWTTVWRNELILAGAYVYGQEQWQGRTAHTFDLTLELLARGAGPDVAPLVTHRFPLDGYAEAIEVNVNRGAHRSVKTLFDMRDEA